MLSAMALSIVIQAGKIGPPPPRIAGAVALSEATPADVRDVELIKRAYQKNPIGLPLDRYKSRFYWRNDEAGKSMSAVWVFAIEGSLGEFIIKKEHQPVIFDGRCSVLRIALDESLNAQFACNGGP